MIFLSDRTVDLSSRRVVGREQDHVLTELEADLLAYLYERSPAAVTREELLEKVWRVSPQSQTRCVDTAVRRLRQKIEADPRRPEHLQKVFGTGYRMTPGSAAPPPAPLRARATNLPPAPVLVGRDTVLAAIVAALPRAPVVTLVGPPGAGLTALALCAAHHAGGHFAGGAWKGSVDPGPGKLWFRDDAPATAAEATQLYTGGARGLPGEHLVFVPAIDDAVRALLLPEVPGLRARIGGLAGLLCRVRSRLQHRPPDQVLAEITHSRAPPDTALDRLRLLAILQGPFHQSRGEQLVGGDIGDLLLGGWLQHQGSELVLPWTVRCRLASPGPDQHRRHADHVQTALAAAARPDPGAAGPTLDCWWPQLNIALAWTAEHDGARFLRLVQAAGPPLHTRQHPEQLRAWLDLALTHPLPPGLRCIGLVHRAEVQRLQGRTRQAHQDLDQADALVREHQLVAEAGRVVVTRAATLLTGGDRRAALTGYLEAADLLDDIDPARACLARQEAARQRFNLGEEEEAVALARRNLQLASRLSDPHAAASCEALLGRMLSALGWHWEGIPRLVRAAEAFDRRTRHLHLALTLHDLATAQVDAGALDQAAATWDRAIEICRERGHGLVEALCTSGRGVVALLQGDLDRARQDLQHSIVLYEDHEQPQRSWYAMGWLAVCLHRLGQRPTRDLALRRSAELAGDRPDQQTMLDLLRAATDPGERKAALAAGMPAGAASDPELRAAYRALEQP